VSQAVAREKEIALLDLLDRIVTKGVVIYGDVTLSIADVDLIYLGLKVLLTSVETADQWKRATAERYQGTAIDSSAKFSHAL
jgi:gas vesicle structural protein